MPRLSSWTIGGMVGLSLSLLGAAACLGLAIAAAYGPLRRSSGLARWMPGLAHALLGLAGYGVLALGLRGAAHGTAMGVGSFRTIAAVLLTGALMVAGIGLVPAVRRRPVVVPVLGLHATLGIGGVVVLLAYVVLAG